MYPKFVEELCPEDIEDNETLFIEYLKWIADIFKDFGIKTILTSDDDKISLEFLNCPWLDDAKTKPVFCLNCQAMINHSYNWTGLSGGMEKKSVITEGHPSCRFDFKQ